ncbi:desumoylating isopeptidase 1, partial [Trichonephila clavata]
MDANGEAALERPELLAETSFDVLLYIYDLSKELAKSFKKILKGKPLPGIWHTGLVAYGREYYFGSTGIESCRPGETILGEPDQILTLGKTELPYSVFLEYIFALGESTYRPGSYHLLEHNCNCFSQEVCQFLTGGPIPAEIRELPQEISGNKTLSTALKEYFNKLSLRAEGSKGISFGPSERVPEEHRNGHAPETATPRPTQNGTRRKKSSAGMSSGNSAQSKQQATPKEQLPVAPEQPQQIVQEPPQQNAVPEFTPAPPAQQQPSQEANEVPPSESNSQVVSNGTELSNGAPRRGSLEESEEGQTTYAPRRARRYEDPPAIFPDVDGAALLKQIMELVEGKLTPEENKDLNEFMEYLTTDGGAWALGASHLETI